MCWGDFTARTRERPARIQFEASAEAGGGQYFNATDADGLRSIAAQIDRLERSPVQRQVIVPWRDRVEIWLIVAAALLLIERTLRLTVFATVP